MAHVTHAKACALAGAASVPHPAVHADPVPAVHVRLDKRDLARHVVAPRARPLVETRDVNSIVVLFDLQWHGAEANKHGALP